MTEDAQRIFEEEIVRYRELLHALIEYEAFQRAKQERRETLQQNPHWELYYQPPVLGECKIERIDVAKVLERRVGSP